MRRWGVRMAVVVTTLLCLGIAGYAGQVWWAKRIAEETYRTVVAEVNAPEGPSYDVRDLHVLVRAWRATPALGLWSSDHQNRVWSDGYGYAMIRTHWMPRRACPELLRRVTGVDLPDDPDAWEDWLKAHPSLVWDEKQKRLVPEAQDAHLPHLSASEIQEVNLIRFGKEGKTAIVRHYHPANDQAKIAEIVQMFNGGRISKTLYETTPETIIEIKTRKGDDIRMWDPFSEFVTVGLKLSGETYRQVEVTFPKPPIFLQAAFDESGCAGEDHP